MINPNPDSDGPPKTRSLEQERLHDQSDAALVRAPGVPLPGIREVHGPFFLIEPTASAAHLVGPQPLRLTYSHNAQTIAKAHQGEVVLTALPRATGSIYTPPPQRGPFFQDTYPSCLNPTLQLANANIDPPSVEKRKRGRPPGVRNKPKDTPKSERRKRGRPLGSSDTRPRKPYTWKTPRNDRPSSAIFSSGAGSRFPSGSDSAVFVTGSASGAPVPSSGTYPLPITELRYTWGGSVPIHPRNTAFSALGSGLSPSPSQRISSSSENTPSPTMPYNNAAIAPPEEITGQCSLPLARVKKILHIDEDTHQVSNNASFVITIATEMFIRYLAEQALNVVKAEKKPRRNIQYKDLANAVARIDNLQFLEDVIPQTTTYREYKARRANKATKVPQPLQNGQTTLDASRPLPQRSLETKDPRTGAPEDDHMSEGTVDDQVTEAQRPESSKANGSGLVFEHYEPNGMSKRDGSGDIEMS